LEFTSGTEGGGKLKQAVGRFAPGEVAIGLQPWARSQIAQFLLGNFLDFWWSDCVRIYRLLDITVDNWLALDFRLQGDGGIVEVGCFVVFCDYSSVRGEEVHVPGTQIPSDEDGPDHGKNDKCPVDSH